MNVEFLVLVVAGFLSEFLTLSNTRKISNNDGRNVTRTQKINNGFLNSPEKNEQSTTPTDSSITTESNCAELPKINLTVEIYIFNVTLKWDLPETSDCEIKYNIYLDDTLKDTTSELSYTIENWYACNNYKVEVAATYGETVGDKTTQNITTKPLVSNPPEEVEPPTPGKDYINVTWKIDNSDVNKCLVKEIFVSCNGYDSPNSNYSWIRREVEPITIQVSNHHDYPMTINGLSPFTNYTCYAIVSNEAGNSSQKEIKTMTDQDIPPAPGRVVVTNTTPNKFTIEWTEPQEVPGVLTGYIIRMTNNSPLYTQSQRCPGNDAINDTDVGPETTTYIFLHNLPYHLITVAVTATDDAGESLPAITNVTTPSSKPDPVANATRDSPTYSQDEIYHDVVTIKFDPPCNMNGPFKNYAVTYNGTRTSFKDHSGIIITTDTTIEIELLPERNYSFEIRVITEDFTSKSVSVKPLISKAGVPLISNVTSPIVVESNKANFTLNKNDFDNSNGEIVAWALILLTSGNYNPGYDFWNGTEDDWPEPPSNSCQFTCKWWNPFNTSDGPTQTNFTIGTTNTNCSSGVCKMPLTDNTDYWLLVRAFTTAAYKDSNLLHFKTKMLDDLNLGLILGLTFGLLALVALIIFTVFLWRKKRKAVIYEEEKRVTVSSDPAPIPVKKFATYCHVKEIAVRDLESESLLVPTHSTNALECVRNKSSKSSVKGPGVTVLNSKNFYAKRGSTCSEANTQMNTSSRQLLYDEDSDLNHGHQDNVNFSDNTPLIASEFLSESPLTAADLFSDFELGLHENEPDFWTPRVGKEVVKKMKEKEVKRQEHIYEFILTEKNYCITLLVVQKVFVEGLQKYFQMGTSLDRMFPRLADLIELHLEFLAHLKRRQTESSIVSTIADILEEQFSDHNAQKLKSAYGEFCSKHREAVEIYKEYLQSDPRFEQFVRHSQSNPLLEKKEIPECILFITQRLTKYPLLIKPLIKTSRDNKTEQETLQRTLNFVKDILVDVDAQVGQKEKEDRKLEIYNKIDVKSSTVYRGLKFEKSDILQGYRTLKFEGSARLMQGRTKMQLVLVIVLSDILFFLQESSQKYVFFTPEIKAGVISLQKLLVMEKAGQDSRGVYLISSNPADPEMFELKVHKPKDKQIWIHAIREAVQTCPEDEESTGFPVRDNIFCEFIFDSIN